MIQVVRRSIVDIYNLYSFSRGSLAYDSKGKLYHLHNARYEPGKFGQAVMVEEGTENKLKTVGGADVTCTSTTGWAYNSAYGTLTVVDDPTCLGGKCLVYEDIDGDTVNDRWDGFYPAADTQSVGPVSPGDKITLSIRYKTENVTTGTVAVWGHWYGYDSAGNLVYNVSQDWEIGPSNGIWQKKTVTLTSPNSASYPNAVSWKWGPYMPGFNKTNLGARIHVDWVQAEVKPYATSFIDGTRAAEQLTIPTSGVLNKDEGTMELWINPITVQSWNNFFSMSISTGRFLLYFDGAGIVYWDYGPADSDLGTGTGVAVAGQWLHVAMRWSASKGSRELFVNGQYIGTKSFTPPDSLPATVSVVNTYGALIDDLRISSRARTDEEIAAAYSSNAPLPVDEWTTLKLDFDGPDAQRAAKVLVV